MNYLKHYADQVAAISNDMKAGKISMEEAAIKLQAVAVLTEESAVQAENLIYSERLKEMADKIYTVVEKMLPEHRVVQ